MKVFVLLFNPGTENEGIHTLSMGDRHLVLMFEDEDDATRYSLLLEAQDFLPPSIERLDRQEIEEFCKDANYEACLVPRGFTPTNQFDRFLLVPPENNLEETTWQADGSGSEAAKNTGGNAADDEPEEYSTEQLDHIRRRLEGLL
ncbi:MAG: DUF3110 domain-containing protein [Prochlorotrichaceae cyanobacterium]|jgi:hypothetical protein